MEWPQTYASPHVGASSVERILIVVVLPAPLGPMKPNRSPRSSLRSSDSRATDAPVAHPSLATISYGYDDSLAALEGVPIAASSSRLFEAEWVATLAAAPVTSRLVRETQGTLRGSCAHHLPFALDGCVFVHGGWLYEVGRLEPDAAFDPSAGRGPRSLAATLTRRDRGPGRRDRHRDAAP